MRSELRTGVKEGPIRSKTAWVKGRRQRKAHRDLCKNSFSLKDSAEEAEL